MKANELRIGVTIKWNRTIKTINNWIELANCTEPNTSILVDPIPLTEEWLLKFWMNDGAVISIADEDFIHWTKDDGVFLYGSSYSTPVYLDNIKYVHQLQNLYFALTGEELTIQEKSPKPSA